MSELPSPGSIFAGKLRIDAVLGRGAMGIVYGATDLTLGRRVALKVIAPEVLDGDQRLRFEREARAAAALRSEHAVRIYETGSSPMPYLVMEYLEGTNLERLVDDHGPLPIADAVAYALEALEVIAEAHRAGFVHRDLKPANLFLDRSRATPIVKVLDFGLVRTTDPSSAALTATGAALGTPLYMAPEQVDAKPVGPPADVWSLGVTLYELLSGHTPFEAPTTMDILTRILREPPVPVRQWRPEVPAGLVAVLERCLAKEPQHRFASGSELAVALAAFAGRGTAPSAHGVPSHVILVAQSTDPVPVPAPKAAGSRTAGFVAGLLATVVVGALAAAGWRFASRNASVATPPSASVATPPSVASAPVPPSASPSVAPPATSSSALRPRHGHRVLAKSEEGFDDAKRFKDWIRKTQPRLDQCVVTKLPCYALSVDLGSDGTRHGIRDVGHPDRAPKDCSPRSDSTLGACLTDALLTAPPPFTCQGAACRAYVLLYVED